MSSGTGSTWNDDKEPETDSHEVIREIVKKIMAKNQALYAAEREKDVVSMQERL